jgi:cytoskeletal protein CcmA (bactofilin family)
VFTFKPAPKNGSNGNGNGNGHKDGNGHTEPSGQGAANGSGNGHAAHNGNGNGHKSGQGLAAWLGLNGGNGNTRANAGAGGHAAERPALKNGNGHGKRIDSIIGPGLSMRGTLTGSGGVRIEGNFDGTIDIKGPVMIADGAKVTAEIRAGAVSVGGSVKGNITAVKVEILATGRVWGDLTTTAFATEEGAFLRGQVRMEDELPAEAPEPEPERVTEAAPI